MNTEGTLGNEHVVREAELLLEPPTAASPDRMDEGDEADEAMARYACGDGAAFAVVYDAICPEITRLLARRLRDRVLVEDLVQDTFVKLHKHRGRFVPGARVRPWAATIAVRLCIDHFRHAAGVKRVIDEEGSADERPCDAPDPEQLAAVLEMVEEVERELGALPALHRDAFLLVRNEGRSLDEAAELLGTTVTAIKLRVFRAASHLREKLRKRGPRDKSDRK